MASSGTSAPNFAAPVAIARASTSGRSRKTCFISLRGRSLTDSGFGTGSLPAASASSPKPSDRLPFQTAWSRAVSDPAGTRHRCAAAAISISRAVAAARRRSSYSPRMLFEPSVF